MRGIVGHLVPDGDLKTGYAVPTRLGWRQVTSADDVTLSDGEGRGERAHCRRSVLKQSFGPVRWGRTERGFCTLITVMAAGHCAALGRAGGSLVTVPVAGRRTCGLKEPSGWKGAA